MRACMLFVTGLLVGVALTSVAAQSAQSPNKGLVGVNHIGMNVPNLDEAVAFYTKTMGFPEAFRVNDEKGQPRLVYVQVSKNTFFEIQPGPGRPAAINHVGIHVENVAAATYLSGIGAIQNNQALKAAASIHPVEMQHAAVLNFVLGNDPAPEGFAKTEGARPQSDYPG